MELPARPRKGAAASERGDDMGSDFFTLLGLILGLIGDLMYTVVDPRIDFERRGV